jgi:hypothetical protein
MQELRAVLLSLLFFVFSPRSFFVFVSFYKKNNTRSHMHSKKRSSVRVHAPGTYSNLVIGINSRYPESLDKDKRQDKKT